MRIDRVVTTGTFSLDGQTWDVANNVFVFGNDTECVVIDPAHDAEAIASVVGSRVVKAILCTHAHDDHINVAWDLVAFVDAPVRLHMADAVLWSMTHTRPPDLTLEDGQVIEVGEQALTVAHTPGHSPGAVCFIGDGVVFGGDTLFRGGPGATGRSYSDFPTILNSIKSKLLVLPEETIVYTGHGDDTTIGAEGLDYDNWVARGY